MLTDKHKPLVDREKPKQVERFETAEAWLTARGWKQSVGGLWYQPESTVAATFCRLAVAHQCKVEHLAGKRVTISVTVEDM